MKLAIFAYSKRGCRTARAIAACFPTDEVRLFGVERLGEDGFEAMEKPTRAFYGGLFAQADAMAFVGSCGIAVREIAPHVNSKQTDPAVLVVDELGTYVIPLLSGHIGGANRLAKALAEKLGAIPVITTATDINHRFSVDAWVAQHGFVIGSMETAKEVSAAVLEGDIPLASDFPVSSAYPKGILPGNGGELGIYIGYETKQPFSRTLQIIPRVLHLGIGCRKGTDAACIREAVLHTLQEHGLDCRGVKDVSSIDLKAEEEGLVTFCREQNWPLECYSAEELMAVEGAFTPSEFVRSVTGVDNVCERAARKKAPALIVKKTALHGVTVAVAAEKVEVSFE